jgi:hypothetical protein
MASALPEPAICSIFAPQFHHKHVLNNSKLCPFEGFADFVVSLPMDQNITKVKSVCWFIFVIW